MSIANLSHDKKSYHDIATISHCSFAERLINFSESSVKDTTMPAKTDTYDRAYSACTTLFTENGAFPTIQAVRERIGVNSPATIKRAINDWTIQTARSLFERRQQPGLPPRLIEAAENLWTQALKEAEEVYVKRQEEWEAQLKGLEGQLQQARLREAELTERLEERESQLQHFQSTLQETIQKKNAVEQESASLQGKVELLQQQVERLEHAQEGTHLWALRRIEEEKEAAAAAGMAAVAKANGRLELLQQALEAERNLHAQQRGKISELERQLRKQKLQGAKDKFSRPRKYVRHD